MRVPNLKSQTRKSSFDVEEALPECVDGRRAVVPWCSRCRCSPSTAFGRDRDQERLRSLRRESPEWKK